MPTIAVLFDRVPVANGRKPIALTFDDGPSRWTPAILNILEHYSAKATFFVLGKAIEEHAAVARRAVDEGHELGNHTQTHPRASALGDDALRAELERASRAIRTAVGVEPTLVRPPYGDDARRVARLAAALGFAGTVLWSIDPRDWTEIPGDAIADHVVGAAEPGAVILLHDGLPRSETFRKTCAPTVDALRRIVPALLDAGYELVTVSDLWRSRAQA